MMKFNLIYRIKKCFIGDYGVVKDVISVKSGLEKMTTESCLQKLIVENPEGKLFETNNTSMGYSEGIINGGKFSLQYINYKPYKIGDNYP